VQIDVSAAMAYVMAAKDDAELITMKKACQATMDLFNKFLKEQLMDLIDKDKVCRSLCLLCCISCSGNTANILYIVQNLLLCVPRSGTRCQTTSKLNRTVTVSVGS